jgi:hypothetical protein
LTMHPLTPELFAAALRDGRGRALWHVRQVGLAAVADLVLAACLHDQAYDPQCESSRAPWLFGMFQGTTEYATFSSAIVAALEQETNDYDAEQLCELAALMGKAGDQKAADALRKRVLREAENGGEVWWGTAELVALDGAPAVTNLARCYGRILAKDPEAMIPPLDALTEDPELQRQYEALLQELAESDSEIRTYSTYSRTAIIHQAKRAKKGSEELEREWKERTRREFPLQRILRDASAKRGDFPSRYMSFGRSATPDELGLVWQRLVEELDEEVCQRLLWVFRRTALPEIPPKAWELAASANHAVRAAAIEALAQLQSEAIGEFGRHILRTGEFTEEDREVLNLFIRNYRAGDEDLIMAALGGLTPTLDNTHTLSSSLLEISEENSSPHVLPLLHWVYERNPCSVCRHRALKLLHELGGLSREIHEECLLDANEDIQRFAKALEIGEKNAG